MPSGSGRAFARFEKKKRRDMKWAGDGVGSLSEDSPCSSRTASSAPSPVKRTSWAVSQTRAATAAEGSIASAPTNAGAPRAAPTPFRRPPAIDVSARLDAVAKRRFSTFHGDSGPTERVGVGERCAKCLQMAINQKQLQHTIADLTRRLSDAEAALAAQSPASERDVASAANGSARDGDERSVASAGFGAADATAGAPAVERASLRKQAVALEKSEAERRQLAEQLAHAQREVHSYRTNLRTSSLSSAESRLARANEQLARTQATQ